MSAPVFSAVAATTQEDRRLHLKSGDPILRHLGPKRLDDITPATLGTWWNTEIGATKRTNATGIRYLASRPPVFDYAREMEFLTESPVDAIR